MPRSVKDIIEHGDELARRFEQYEPRRSDERDPEVFAALHRAAIQRSEAEDRLRRAVAEARASGYTWRSIGSIIGTSGEAARQRYGVKQRA